MNIRWIVVLTALISWLPTQAQLHGYSVDVAPGYSYVRPDVNFGSVLGLPQRAVVTSYPFAIGLEASLRAELYEHNSVAIDAHVGSAYYAFGWNASEPTVFNVAGQPLPGAFSHELRGWWAAAHAGVTARLVLSNSWMIGGGLWLSLPVTSDAVSVESIVSPEGIEYSNGGTTRTRFNGPIREMTASMRVNGRITYIALRPFQPFIDVGANFTSIVATAKVFPLFAGVGVSIPLGRSHEYVYTPPALTAPAVYEAAHPHAVRDIEPPPLLSRLDTSRCGFVGTAIQAGIVSKGKVLQSAVSVVKRCVRIDARIRKPSGDVPDGIMDEGFPDSLVAFVKDTVVLANPPVARLVVAGAADAGVYYQDVTAVVDREVVFHQRSYSSTDTMYMKLEELPVGLIRQRKAHILVQSSITDSCNTVAMSLQSTIELVLAHDPESVPSIVMIPLDHRERTVKQLIDQAATVIPRPVKVVARDCPPYLLESVRQAFPLCTFEYENNGIEYARPVLLMFTSRD